VPWLERIHPIGMPRRGICSKYFFVPTSPGGACAVASASISWNQSREGRPYGILSAHGDAEQLLHLVQALLEAV